VPNANDGIGTLQQATIAVMAQANTSAQAVLALLKG